MKTLKKEYFRDYSKWSLEASIGMPFFSGDINSLSDDKTYIGGQYGVKLGYQITPTIGLGLSGTYGRNKAGSPDYAKDYILGADGMTYYPPPDHDRRYKILRYLLQDRLLQFRTAPEPELK